jgi:hypothetical protein
MAESAGCGFAKIGCKLGAGAMGGLSSSFYTSIFKEEDFRVKDGMLCGVIAGKNSCYVLIQFLFTCITKGSNAMTIQPLLCFESDDHC